MNVHAPQINRLIAESPGGRLIGDRWKEDPVVPMAVGLQVADEAEYDSGNIVTRLLEATIELLESDWDDWPATVPGKPQYRRIEVPLIVAEMLEWYVEEYSQLYAAYRLPGVIY